MALSLKSTDDQLEQGIYILTVFQFFKISRKRNDKPEQPGGDLTTV